MAERAAAPAHGPIPRQVLLLLALLVLLAHGLALRQLALDLDTALPVATRAFTTRSIAIGPAVPPALPRRPITATPPPPPAPAPPKPPPAATADALQASARPLPQEAASAAPVEAALPPPAQAASEPASAPTTVAQPAPPEVPEPPAAEPAAAAQAAPPAVDAQQAAAQPFAAGDAPVAGPWPMPGTAAPLANAPAQATRQYTVPGSVRLNFDATGKRGRFDYKAMGTLTWLQDGSSYDMRLEMGDWFLGKRVLTSKGAIGADGLAPTRFSDKFRSERAAHFDRAQHRIVFSANTAPAPLLPGAQDQLSIFAQLASMLGGDPAGFAVGSTVQIQTAGPREAEAWTFTVEGPETLQLPGGALDTFKLSRNPGKDYDQKVEVWLAPTLAWLPARIRITFANGDYLDQQWRSTSAP